MTLTPQKLPSDFTTEPNAIEWQQFLHPGSPDEWTGEEELLDEEAL